MILALSIAAFVFSLAVLVYVATDDWRCPVCHRYRRRQADGWRRCSPCRTGWRIEDYPPKTKGARR